MLLYKQSDSNNRGMHPSLDEFIGMAKEFGSDEDNGSRAVTDLLILFWTRSTKILPAGRSTVRHWPLLSTSILSRPRGPRELLIMVAMDCAVIPKKDMSNQTEKWDEKTNHLGPRHPVRTLCHHPGKTLLMGRIGRGQKF